MAKKGKSPFLLKKLVLLFDAGQKYIEKATMYFNVLGSIKNKPFSLILESFSLPNVGAATCLRFENLEIDNIDKLIDYLNKIGSKKVREQKTRKGKIEVICGPMFSGKTEELIRRLKRLTYSRTE